MRHRVPERYTILITRTGQAPRVVTFRPVVLLMGLVLVLAWVGVTAFLYSRNLALQESEQRLAQLAEQTRVLAVRLSEEQSRNRALAGDAARLLEELDRLEAEVDRLRERAGLPKAELTPARGELPARDGQGGGVPLDTEGMLELTAKRLEMLTDRLNDQIEPALEEVLAREEARPAGYPLAVKTYIASGFGTRRNPFGSGYEFHDGLDLPANYGTPIHATAAGKVIEAGWSRIFGNYVKIDHGYGYRTLYGHMSEILVREGEQVARGQTIGRVGSTGRSSGPHLHYAVFVWGKAVNPVPYLEASARAAR